MLREPARIASGSRLRRGKTTSKRKSSGTASKFARSAVRKKNPMTGSGSRLNTCLIGKPLHAVAIIRAAGIVVLLSSPNFKGQMKPEPGGHTDAGRA